MISYAILYVPEVRKKKTQRTEEKVLKRGVRMISLINPPLSYKKRKSSPVRNHLNFSF